jgi:hypothetical protein
MNAVMQLDGEFVNPEKIALTTSLICLIGIIMISFIPLIVFFYNLFLGTFFLHCNAAQSYTNLKVLLNKRCQVACHDEGIDLVKQEAGRTVYKQGLLIVP